MKINYDELETGENKCLLHNFSEDPKLLSFIDEFIALDIKNRRTCQLTKSMKFTEEDYCKFVYFGLYYIDYMF